MEREKQQMKKDLAQIEGSERKWLNDADFKMIAAEEITKGNSLDGSCCQRGREEASDSAMAAACDQGLNTLTCPAPARVPDYFGVALGAFFLGERSPCYRDGQ
ncbi:uncharacterized protein A4U43_C03F16160 [Asparagus officinalis]|uniref:Uncharacterized protein n=1 Tax=Asparagus officinalis TaxID=4686 RepID=A0A5P1FBE4_ASPOF|nr:uncharacterized protein A4U43_C03F16160 [Asparagus officinalis]